jgi:hypothetical protein
MSRLLLSGRIEAMEGAVFGLVHEVTKGSNVPTVRPAWGQCYDHNFGIFINFRQKTLTSNVSTSFGHFEQYFESKSTSFAENIFKAS